MLGNLGPNFFIFNNFSRPYNEIADTRNCNLHPNSLKYPSNFIFERPRVETINIRRTSPILYNTVAAY